MKEYYSHRYRLYDAEDKMVKSDVVKIYAVSLRDGYDKLKDILAMSYPELGNNIECL